LKLSQRGVAPESLKPACCGCIPAHFASGVFFALWSEDFAGNAERKPFGLVLCLALLRTHNNND
jgi:hypothetical protein